MADKRILWNRNVIAMDMEGRRAETMVLSWEWGYAKHGVTRLYPSQNTGMG
jgi:hypothetical protein